MPKPIYFYYAIILLGVVFRVWGISEKNGFTHDESISYLSAAGTQGEYQKLLEGNEEPLELLVKSERFNFLFTTDTFFSFKTIAYDLANYDIHPPLYFWMLHLLVYIFGVGFKIGLILNLFISLLFLLGFYRLSRELQFSKEQSLLIIGVWYLAPAVMISTFEARHYELFGFVSLLFLLKIISASKKEKLSVTDNIQTALLIAAGFLTHYYFLIVLVGGLFFITIKKLSRKILLYYSAAVILSALIFLALFPEFLTFLSGYNGRLNGDSVSVLIKAKVFLYNLFAFFTTIHYGKYLTGVILILIAMYFVLKYKLYSFQNILLLRISTNFVPLFFAVWFFSAFLFLYIINITPNQAVGGEYFSMFWPFFTISIYVALKKVVGVRPVLKFAIPLLIMILVYSNIDQIKNADYINAQYSKEELTEINKADLVIMTDKRRGNLPRNLYWTMSNQMVYAGKKFVVSDLDTFNKIIVLGQTNQDRKKEFFANGFEFIKSTTNAANDVTLFERKIKHASQKKEIQ
ncbi:MAG: glycosyltransferase family 39 protein [Melioribacteraceae bacterium]|nr:glycosyltransferase family 39 protein [Melioribacteraceae bacterium]MCF8262873.1 glycosyltransferase family 39 protein [Melioribacteraceae bacterium]